MRAREIDVHVYFGCNVHVQGRLVLILSQVIANLLPVARLIGQCPQIEAHSVTFENKLQEELMVDRCRALRPELITPQ